MKRFVVSVGLVTLVGLAVVTGEVEAVKIGYRIRQLNMEKLDLVNRLKTLEFEIASLKTPTRLEQWMGTSRVKLGSSKTMALAQVPRQKSAPHQEKASKPTLAFARWFVGTAQADSEK